MRITWTASLASLWLASGCAAAELVVPPATGAGIGALVGRDRRNHGSEVSVANHAVLGAVLGVLVDAVAIAIIVNQENIIHEPVTRR
jgi:hypothetical protein